MIELVRLAPELVTDLLSSRFGVSLSEGVSATPFSEAARVVRPRTFHADAAFVCAAAGGEPELAVVFEVQRAFDPGKRETWRLYLSHIENETKAPAALVVYCPDPRVGQRYREMAATDGISLVLRPFVVTPDDLPLEVDPQEAERRRWGSCARGWARTTPRPTMILSRPSCPGRPVTNGAGT
ncbi:MAG: hypothetical protein QM621_02330 [Aeromicrobium sp.]|uniref:hypothetical protein n=1 Tax=Aeromicrobium sp. TaxID=1871063 RepID=UPI0039E30B54